jgi:hypothetical protein
MSSTWRHAAAALAADLRHVFSSRLRSIVAYGPRIDGTDEDGPLTCMALVESCGVPDLEACARLTHHWSRHQLAIPLILPEQEFRQSLDAFPLEYGEIIRAHEVVFGTNPFEGTSISKEDLRRACETQVKSHLVHLREGFIESGGRPGTVASLVAASAPAFAALLRNVATLGGAAAASRADSTHQGARLAGLNPGVVNDVLALENAGTIPTADPARLFPDYLAAVEQLARAVDSWRS